jgi:hypothetical protein
MYVRLPVPIWHSNRGNARMLVVLSAEMDALARLMQGVRLGYAGFRVVYIGKNWKGSDRELVCCAISYRE